MTDPENRHSDDSGASESPRAGGVSKEPWRTPTLRVLAAAATESGLPDDVTERPFYETKPS